MASVLKQILKTCAGRVEIKDTGRVEQILHKLVLSGVNSLNVFADFDGTLTRYHKDGQKCDTTYGILGWSPLISEDYRNRTTQLFEKYYAIEIDSNMSIEEKMPHMIEWDKKSQENLISSRLEENKIKEMVAQSKAYLRDNLDQTFTMLNKSNVPVIVVSAGVENLVSEIISYNNLHFSNIHIVSNLMIFNKAGQLSEFKEPHVHMYNKNTAILHPNYRHIRDKVSQRSNAIVIGDCIGDANMADGFPCIETVLKIGFLNSNVDEHMDSFMKNFDLVLVNDQTMEVVNCIILQCIGAVELANQ